MKEINYSAKVLNKAKQKQKQKKRGGKYTFCDTYKNKTSLGFKKLWRQQGLEEVQSFSNHCLNYLNTNSQKIIDSWAQTSNEKNYQFSSRLALRT